MPPIRYLAVALGPLPVDAINAALGTELLPGNARLSARAHQHMAEDHAQDYKVCFAALLIATASPTFVGQAPDHSRNFEMVWRTERPDGRAVLVAVSVEMDAQGEYRVRTCYLISATTLANRRASGRLKELRQPETTKARQ